MARNWLTKPYPADDEDEGRPVRVDLQGQDYLTGSQDELARHPGWEAQVYPARGGQTPDATQQKAYRAFDDAKRDIYGGRTWMFSRSRDRYSDR